MYSRLARTAKFIEYHSRPLVWNGNKNLPITNIVEDISKGRQSVSMLNWYYSKVTGNTCSNIYHYYLETYDTPTTNIRFWQNEDLFNPMSVLNVTNTTGEYHYMMTIGECRLKLLQGKFKVPDTTLNISDFNLYVKEAIEEGDLRVISPEPGDIAYVNSKCLHSISTTCVKKDCNYLIISSTGKDIKKSKVLYHIKDCMLN